MSGTQRFIAGALLALTPLLPGCRSATETSVAVEPEVLLRRPEGFFFQLVATPDGAMFASSEEGVYRNLDPLGPWEPIGGPSEVVTGLYAPSTDMVFALTRGCAQLQQWTAAAGWKELKTPVSDSSWADGHFINCIRLLDIQGRNAHDIYVVGSRGTILHFDGTTWELEANPFIPQVGARGTGYDSSTFWSVAVDADAVYAGGAVLLRKAEGGAWGRVDAGESQLPSSCGYTAAATHHGVPVFGDYKCLVELRDERLRLLANPLSALVDGLFRGQTQPDGGAVFWSYLGDIADLHYGRPRVSRLRGVGAVGGIVAIDGFLYAAGRGAEGGVIVRIPRASR